jgi:hypothetical protein
MRMCTEYWNELMSRLFQLKTCFALNETLHGLVEILGIESALSYFSYLIVSIVVSELCFLRLGWFTY